MSSEGETPCEADDFVRSIRAVLGILRTDLGVPDEDIAQAAGIDLVRFQTIVRDLGAMTVRELGCIAYAFVTVLKNRGGK